MEAHCIAYVYHWERDTIMNLPRLERKAWVDIIMKQKEAEKEEIESSTPSVPNK
jgi:hypothetical protein